MITIDVGKEPIVIPSEDAWGNWDSEALKVALSEMVRVSLELARYKNHVIFQGTNREMHFIDSRRTEQEG